METTSTPPPGITAYILPWLQVNETFDLMGYRLQPRAEAIMHAGDLAQELALATSYFFESYRREALDDRSGPTELVPVEPSVILLRDTDDIGHVSAAVDGLFFATMLRNSPYGYANATNFVQIAVPIRPGSNGRFSRYTRTLFGSSILATDARTSIETRPAWCGKWYGADADVMALYSAIVDHPDAEPVLQAIRALYAAMSDTLTDEADLEHAAYARALERLLHRPTQKHYKRASAQDVLAGKVLEDTLSGQHRQGASATGNVYSSANLGIVRAMTWIRDERNASWHPDQQRRGSPLSNQMTIRPNLVAFHVVAALALASMGLLAPAALTGHLRAYIATCEDWVSEVDDLVTTDPTAALERFGSLYNAHAVRVRS